MREADHEDVISELKDRGFTDEQLSWVDEYWQEKVTDFSEDETDPILDISDSAVVLDKLSVEGQVSDGMFESPRSEYDFTRFFTDTVDGKMLGRQLYIMLSTQGLDYTYEDLVDDVEELAWCGLYNAPFDREEALQAKPY